MRGALQELIRAKSDEDCVEALLHCLRGESINANFFQDWQLADYRFLLRLIRWHRVAPLFLRHCSSCFLSDTFPLPFQQSLKKMVQDYRYHSLAQVAMLPRINGIFTQGNIDFLYLKGVVLSSLLYGNAHHRHSKDIDLWVAPKDVEAACKLLLNSGFRLAKPTKALCDIDLNAYLNIQKDLVFVSDNNLAVELELHWRLDKNRYAFPLSFEQAYSQRRTVVVDDIHCDTLSDIHTLLYLCAHGSAAMYGRIKWLSDVTQMFAYCKNDTALTQKLPVYSQTMRLLPSLCLTEMLMARLFNAKTNDIGKRSYGLQQVAKQISQNIKNAAYLPLLPRWCWRFFLVGGMAYKFEQLRLGMRLFRHKFCSNSELV